MGDSLVYKANAITFVSKRCFTMESKIKFESELRCKEQQLGKLELRLKLHCLRCNDNFATKNFGDFLREVSSENKKQCPLHVKKWGVFMGEAICGVEFYETRVQQWELSHQDPERAGHPSN